MLSAAAELEEGRSVVRAVIVKTWGSTPREVGADMLVRAEGSPLGTIGGGCGEAEIYEIAREMLSSPQAKPGYLCHVDLTENPEEGGDKVCGGRFDVLLHRLEPELHRPLLSATRERLQVGQQVCWGTEAVGGRPGFWKRGEVRIPVGLSLTVREGATEGPVWEKTREGTEIFLEPLGRVLRLVIVGAGHIARPLSRLAAEVGYMVTVLDDRADYARAEYFPEAAEVVAGDYAATLPELAASSGTSVVLVTRGHKHDQDCLRLMAGKPLDYLGMIGSQRRIEAVYAELVEEGYSLEALRSVHAPIGLEIGAHTPAEIAVSILAQMIKVRRLPGHPSREARERKRHQRTLQKATAEPGDP